MAIHTDASGLWEGGIVIAAADREIPGYRAGPASGGGFPVVLVVQEIFGVNEYIRDVCRRLGKEGYLAIAAELFVRQGEVSGMSDVGEILSRVVSKVPDAQVMADLDAAVDWARKSGGDASRLGITGFCWGGRIAWLYAAHNPGLRAGVAWYGRLAGDPDPRHPRHPVDVAAELKAPVLGLYGGQDQSIPPATVDQMREALRQAERRAEIAVYPEAGHAFHSDYRPSYRQAAAEDGWKRMLAWFRRYGVAGGWNAR